MWVASAGSALGASPSRFNLGASPCSGSHFHPGASAACGAASRLRPGASAVRGASRLQPGASGRRASPSRFHPGASAVWVASAAAGCSCSKTKVGSARFHPGAVACARPPFFHPGGVGCTTPSCFQSRTVSWRTFCARRKRTGTAAPCAGRFPLRRTWTTEPREPWLSAVNLKVRLREAWMLTSGAAVEVSTAEAAIKARAAMRIVEEVLRWDVEFE